MGSLLFLLPYLPAQLFHLTLFLNFIFYFLHASYIQRNIGNIHKNRKNENEMNIGVPPLSFRAGTAALHLLHNKTTRGAFDKCPCLSCTPRDAQLTGLASLFFSQLYFDIIDK